VCYNQKRAAGRAANPKRCAQWPIAGFSLFCDCNTRLRGCLAGVVSACGRLPKRLQGACRISTRVITAQAISDAIGYGSACAKC
jgi:hypothetical protein